MKNKNTKPCKGSVLVEFMIAILLVVQMVIATADIARLGYSKSIMRYMLTKSLKEAQRNDNLYNDIWSKEYDDPDYEAFRTSRTSILNSSFSSLSQILPAGIEISKIIHHNYDVSKKIHHESQTPFALLLPGTSISVEGLEHIVNNTHKCLSFEENTQCNENNKVNLATDSISSLATKYPITVASYANFKPITPFLQDFKFKVSVSGYRLKDYAFEMPENPNNPPPELPCDPGNPGTHRACASKDHVVDMYNTSELVEQGLYPPITTDFIGILHNDITFSTAKLHPILGYNGWEFKEDIVCGDRAGDSDTDYNFYECGNLDEDTCTVFCNRTDIGCFTKDTQIITSRGSVSITKIRADDLILNPIDNKYYEIKKVVAGPEEKPVFRIIANDGSQITVTEDHPMILDTGIKRAGEIIVGNKLLKSKGNLVKVIEVDKFKLNKEDNLVYNIELKTNSSNPYSRSLSANNFATSDLKTQIQISKKVN